MVPIDEINVRAFLFDSRYATGLQAITHRLSYHLRASWSLHYFIGQDTVVCDKQDYASAERLAAIDVGVVKW